MKSLYDYTDIKVWFWAKLTSPSAWHGAQWYRSSTGDRTPSTPICLTLSRSEFLCTFPDHFHWASWARMLRWLKVLYLGVRINAEPRWRVSSQAVYKMCIAWLYFLRKLKEPLPCAVRSWRSSNCQSASTIFYCSVCLGRKLQKSKTPNRLLSNMDWYHSVHNTLNRKWSTFLLPAFLFDPKMTFHHRPVILRVFSISKSVYRCLIFNCAMLLWQGTMNNELPVLGSINTCIHPSIYPYNVSNKRCPKWISVLRKTKRPTIVGQKVYWLRVTNFIFLKVKWLLEQQGTGTLFIFRMCTTKNTSSSFDRIWILKGLLYMWAACVWKAAICIHWNIKLWVGTS